MKYLFAAASALALATTTTPADAALVALYQFDNAANLGHDSSGNGNHAFNNGATSAAAGYQGGAAAFDGQGFNGCGRPLT